MTEIKKFYNENLMIIANVVKGITGVVGASLILTENHPYLSLVALAIGAGVNEYILYIEKSKNYK